MTLTAATYGIEETEATKTARKRVLAHIQLGEKERQRLIKYCAENIPIDSYVPPSRMEFDLDQDGKEIGEATTRSPVVINYLQGPPSNPRGNMSAYRIHPHALGQLCDLVGLPRIWMNKINQDSPKHWRRSLLVNDLNTMFKNTVLLNARKKPAEFLHRRVGAELRAVLTQSYNRHLVSAAVLQPFLAVCDELNLKAAAASITDMKVGLQMYLPFAFEPIPGEFIAMGVWWGNSDFGQGKLRVSHTIMRLATGSSVLTEDSFSRVHLGSVVTDTDLKMSDEVAVRELEAVAAATQSAVRSAMEPEQVAKVLNAIKQADAVKIAWTKLKENFAKFLTQSELTDIQGAMSEGIQELPPAGRQENGEYLPSRWWAAAALAHLANKQMDEGRAVELKLAAGTFLEEVA